MSKPDYLDQLISEASTAAGSDYKLAQMLEVPRQNLSAWKHGRKACPVSDVALMAEIAGLKPEEWMARAVVAQYEGTSKGDKLFRALGKALVATGAAVVSSGASAHLIFSHKGGETIGGAVSYFIRCIERLSLPRFNYRSFNLA
jgi:DNA-binding transcriptional regulator YdaS (Cro superfamily)